MGKSHASACQQLLALFIQTYKLINKTRNEMTQQQEMVKQEMTTTRNTN